MARYNTGICCLKPRKPGAFLPARMLLSLYTGAKRSKPWPGEPGSAVICSVKRYAQLYFQRKRPKPQQLLISGGIEAGYGALPYLKLGCYAEENLGFSGLQKTAPGESAPARPQDLEEPIYFFLPFYMLSEFSHHIHRINRKLIPGLLFEFSGSF